MLLWIHSQLCLKTRSTVRDSIKMSPGNEVFVIPVLSQKDWHLDECRFLTIIKILGGTNVWLIVDKI
jgi:hypothetical protein